MVAAMAAVPKSGAIASAPCASASPRKPNMDMGEPSTGLVVPGCGFGVTSRADAECGAVTGPDAVR
ncbi:hypothetical protein Scani_63860 [Streptomyces caniferus]|uniref:Uncharacterized protein n=1 Tax=Streptomyces caniferus TaxID=285557 RepID=A0A640SGB6_9ACTN|nr:hypothetical protein Scani_63860 [Streptomyces caniferus]